MIYSHFSINHTLVLIVFMWIRYNILKPFSKNQVSILLESQFCEMKHMKYCSMDEKCRYGWNKQKQEETIIFFLEYLNCAAFPSIENCTGNMLVTWDWLLKLLVGNLCLGKWDATVFLLHLCCICVGAFLISSYWDGNDVFSTEECWRRRELYWLHL